ncbi:hypothetical protein [Kordiimonas pumila]|uniref:DUF4010 domain-containing protein n=1 Tax=Kordiimonas pumila TaxID=2161677 RepID=A0ABV7D1Q7_9PROT|nr:hypothetical protein [Kordiimonas pumila]
MKLIDYIVIVIAVFVLWLLMRKPVRENSLWRATVTPLASIIGSGFLIVAPLLAEVAGSFAASAMAGIIVVAYGLGAVIRYNIRYAEPLINDDDEQTFVERLEHLSRLALAFAYVISVTFYLRLLASFVLEGVGMRTELLGQGLTTAVLVFLGVVGAFRGLKIMERMEEYAVSIKLAIIAALVVGLAYYDVGSGYDLGSLSAGDMGLTERLRMLAGMLLVVQGFETSRYLGATYGTEMRVKSMRFAQGLSGIIYIAFVALVLPLLQYVATGNPDETAIIELTGRVAGALAVMLIIAAIMSQFSAAVADTIGAGGLVEEQTKGKVKAQYAYIAIVAVSVVLVWTVDIFAIVSYASRAFAAYYLLQTLIAIKVASVKRPSTQRLVELTALSCAAMLLLLITIFAIPAD